MKNNTWIKKSLLLGLVFFLAIFLVKPVGVSTQFSMLSGLVHSKIDSQIIQEDSQREGIYTSTNAYYAKSKGKLIKSMQEPLNYSFVFVLAIPLGAYLAHYRRRQEMDSLNSQLKPAATTGQLFRSGFIGGFIILYGSRMAGGCTSGHMMSGIMQGSVSGLIFAAAVFATAIPTAFLMKRIYRGGTE